MNKSSLLFVGFLFTFTTSWLGLVVAPYFQIGHLHAVTDEDTKNSFPPKLSGLAEQGRKVYAANGCIYCHSQQVRGENQGSDLARGWGARRTVPRDYIYDRPVFLGTMRTGPDLANIGARQRGEAGAKWLHLHFYWPQAMSPGSIMPNFRFLYRMQKIVGNGSKDALHFPETGPQPYIPDGYEIVPTEEAKALVAYLQELNHNYPLPEAPTN
jgi:cytochrome c oxidase cbb3-type subunit 2